jgi:6-phosphogluconolactonase
MQYDNNKTTIIFDNKEQMLIYTIQQWIKISQDAIEKNNNFTVALSGGKTPLPLYIELAQFETKIPWDHSHLFMVDERFVPYDHDDSNFGMIKKNLIEKLKRAKIKSHPIPIEKTAILSAEKYNKNLVKIFNLKKGTLPKFDLIILGIGEDGHTASLFPGNPALNIKNHLSIAISHQKIKYKRITLSLPVLNSAKNIIFLVQGKKKANTVHKILKKNDRNLPASLILPIHGRLSFLLDKDAASLLK